jgi:hypothetical protein
MSLNVQFEQNNREKGLNERPFFIAIAEDALISCFILRNQKAGVEI